MTEPTASAPTTNGRVIALAHYAARAVLESVLTRHGATFHQSVTLKSVLLAGGSVAPDRLVADVINSLKIEESAVREVVAEMTASKLLEPDPADPTRLHLTPTGRELLDTTSAETAEISARLYAGIPAEDLAVAGRVLTLVTERANAELARA
ncbi:MULTISPECIES: MarR family transcriptional regulator [unclassified Streptomyces]|uniref:MarR family winged helix-turn-helix transcriptional regulator n=1 Tax=unclassified Streptomyces TaxID=2593676 RepID=UPI002E31967E|nr:MarR family transcriptional regulator [Streptomyces sp. NBC_01268]